MFSACLAETLAGTPSLNTTLGLLTTINSVPIQPEEGAVTKHQVNSVLADGMVEESP